MTARNTSTSKGTQMARYLDTKLNVVSGVKITDSIKNATTSQKTLQCWSSILSLYLPREDGFEQKFEKIEPTNENALIVSKTYKKPGQSSTAKSVSDKQCVIVVSGMPAPGSEGAEWNTWGPEESGVFAYLRSLDNGLPDKTSFGILASGSSFVVFKVTGSTPDPLIGNDMLQPKLDGKGTASTELEKLLLNVIKGDFAARGKCKSLVLTGNTTDVTTSTNAARSEQQDMMVPNSRLLTVSAKSTLTYLQVLGNKKLIKESHNSKDHSVTCWRGILSSYIGTRDDILSIDSKTLAGNSFVELVYTTTALSTSTSTSQPPRGSSKKSLIIVEIIQTPLDWATSLASMHAIIKDHDQSLGILACQAQFVLFQVSAKDGPRFLMGSNEAPENLQQLGDDSSKNLDKFLSEAVNSNTSASYTATSASRPTSTQSVKNAAPSVRTTSSSRSSTKT